jgi:hypothetical protein
VFFYLAKRISAALLQSPDIAVNRVESSTVSRHGYAININLESFAPASVLYLTNIDVPAESAEDMIRALIPQLFEVEVFHKAMLVACKVGFREEEHQRQAKATIKNATSWRCYDSTSKAVTRDIFSDLSKTT